MIGDRDVVVVAGARTPFAKAGTLFGRVSAVELGRVAVREAIERAEIDPEAIDEVVVGNIAGPADAANVGRVIALEAKVPRKVPAFTVLRDHGGTVLAGTLASLATFVLFYLMTVFTLAWGTAELGYSRERFLIMQLFGILCFAVTIPISAKIAERGHPRHRGAAVGVCRLPHRDRASGPVGP